MSYRLSSYFETLITEVHWCSGSPATGGKNLEVWHTPQQCRSLKLKLSQYKPSQGDVAAWFKTLVSLDGTTVTDLKCWREQEGQLLCDDKRRDIQGLVVSLPIMLMLEIGESPKPPVWNFPGTLIPLTKAMAKCDGLIYDLVGFGLHSQKGHVRATAVGRARSGTRY